MNPVAAARPALVCLLMLAASAAAQTQSDIDAARRQVEQLQRLEQERRERELDALRQRDRPVDGLDTRSLQPKIEVAPLDAPCRDIRRIEITNAPNLSWSTRGRLASEFEGRCLGVADIERMLGEITRDYIERGFITARAYLPPQDLTAGRLEILVAEGTVGKLRVEDGGKNSVSIWNVFPLVEGRLLNLRDLEQGIDQLNRLPSNDAKLDIQPGERPGSSEVVIKNDVKKVWRLGGTWDNNGQRTTGKFQRGANLGLDNPLGFNEFLNATYRESVHGNMHHRNSSSTALFASVPFGYTLATATVSRAKYASTLALPSGSDILSSGDSASDGLRLDRVIWRGQSTRFTLGTGVTKKAARAFLGGQLLEVSSRNLTVLDVDAGMFTALAGGTLGLDIGYARGLSALGALQDADELPDSVPRAQFKKRKYGVNYSLPFALAGEQLSFTSALVGQRADNTLYGSEQISVGGLYTVRGFERSTLAGDHGYYFRNELSLRRALKLGGETIGARVYLGYDFGSVRNRVANIPQGRLSGGALGVAGGWRGLNFDASLTRGISRPDFLAREPTQFWFRVGYTF